MRVGLIVAAASAGVLTAAAALSTASHAAAGRWTADFGQGITAASVSTRRGVTFSVVCPTASPTARPGLSLDVPGLRGGADDAAVGAVLAVDGRNHFFVFRRRILDQGQVALVWESRAPGVHQQMAEVLRRMRAGRYLIVSLPSQRVQETFPLRDAREALTDCPGANG